MLTIIGMTHVHIFDIPPPAGAVTEGKCRICGERRQMFNATPERGFNNQPKGKKPPIQRARFSREVKDNVLSELDAGRPVEEIAHELGCGVSTINQWVTARRKDTFLGLIARGLSVEEAAQSAGIRKLPVAHKWIEEAAY